MAQITDKIQVHSSQVQSYTPRTVTYQQAEHTVVPVAMMVEGVHKDVRPDQDNDIVFEKDPDSE